MSMILRVVPFIQQKPLSKCWILQGVPTPLCCFGEAEQLTALACFTAALCLWGTAKGFDAFSPAKPRAC